MDEAEQLCDRLVVMDRGKIVAEGAPRSLIEEYSTREGRELCFQDGNRPDDLGCWAEGRVSRVSPLPVRGPLHTWRRDEGARGCGHARAWAPAREPPRASEPPRGRRPAPPGPEPHRVSSLELTARPYEFFFAQYKRVWRATLVSSVVTPVFYLLALGVGMSSF